MYESPIMVNVTNPIFESMNKAQNEYVIRACQRIGVDINQEELIKALQYDRSQYEKGYADGIAYKPHVETNADRIRAMTDEELAQMFRETASCELCKLKKQYCSAYCKDTWIEWLRQEAEEGENAD